MYKIIFFPLIFIYLSLFSSAQKAKDVVLENPDFKLVIGSNGITKSLLFKQKNIECLAQNEGIAAFAATQERPYDNEVKLAHLNKKTTFVADTIYKTGSNRLVVGFETIPYKAVVEYKITNDYIWFTLVDFIIEDKGYRIIRDYMTLPMTSVFTMLQLPVKQRINFGEWLNVMWDDEVAVSVLATDEFTQISSEKRKGFQVMKAEAVKSIRLKNTGAALVVASQKTFLDKIAKVEDDFNLPKGVQSRRGDFINASYFWASDLNLQNVDSYIEYAKKFGFRTLLVYYPSFTEGDDYRKLGDYDWRKATYPNGKADLIKVLQKIKQAGIRPGLHVLHCHIGRESRYARPIPDYRLNLSRAFNVSRPVGKADTVIYVEQNPEGSMMAEKCRILKIGNELVYYKSFTTTRPYMFTGCKRGVDGTSANEVPLGTQIGILDISEFLAQSIYVNQDNSLQDEIADKIANIYDAGFEFIYFDGSEGVNPPFNYTVPLAQYRVYKKLKPEPLFSEGAAKSHFSWHMLSGANAFDVFSPEEQKEALRVHQLKQAPRMKADFTRLNFGWMSYSLPDSKTIGTQPDVLEFVTSKAAGWDSPIAMFANMKGYKSHARTADNIEVIRRWEYVRAKNWLTEAQKKLLQNPDQEYTLIINEKESYELLPYELIQNVAGKSRDIRAFIFNRKGQWNVVYWHISDNKNLSLPVSLKNMSVFKDFSSPAEIIHATNGKTIIPAGDKRYIKFNNLTKDQIIKAFGNARIVD